MFYEPETYLVPTRRRATNKLAQNNDKIKAKLRENLGGMKKDKLDVADINDRRPNKYMTREPKDHLNLHKSISGAQPKLKLAKKYNENDTFDYSDINVSRRVIRKMVQSSLFDHKPYEKAKYIDKILVGNKFLSKVDPIVMNDPAKSVSSFNITKPFRRSRCFRGSNDYLGSSRRKISLYGNKVNQSLDSLSFNNTQSLKDFRSCAPYAGSATKKDAFDINTNPYHQVRNDITKQLNASTDNILTNSIQGRRHPRRMETRHHRHNTTLIL
ncbi:unnamed protein product [Moneuplotes crassus]|uniref:Uncharacterized protein n=1 Tax=Euplotes crassus TaxID=5936 RepID=A0AAD1XSJ7_EUPCR|nr:unnamed protein product [Moneuplotes crassus]